MTLFLSKLIIPQLIRILLFIFILFIPMKTSIYPISFSLIVFFVAFYLAINQKLFLIKNILQEHKKLVVAFLFIILSMVLANLFSNYSTLYSWRIVANYIFRYFLLFIILLLLYKETLISKRFILICILCSLCLQSIDGIYQAFTTFDFIKLNPGSLFGKESIELGLTAATFNRNTFGFFMAQGAVLSTAFLIKKEFYFNKKEYFYFLLMVCFFLFTLIFSYSRSAWIFYITFLILFIVFEKPNLSKNNLFTLLIIILIVIGFFAYFETLSARLLALVHLNTSDRNIIWLDVISLIKKEFFFGYGIMTYEKITSQPITSVHNSLLEIFLFLGFTGVISFSYLLYVIFQKVLSTKNSIYFSLCISYFIITLFDHSIIKSIPMLSSLSLFAFFIYSHDLND